MIDTLFIFVVSLFFVIKGATLATRYASLLAETYRLSKYTVGFLVIAVISILPETFISLNAALTGNPSFGLGVLYGSNVADLTLIFALLVFIGRRGLRIEGRILQNQVVYPFILLIPLILGINGHYSRLEGLSLIIIGGVFYYLALKSDHKTDQSPSPRGKKLKNGISLIGSMALLLTGAHFTVASASTLAFQIGINPILIGMLIVGIGTTMPEFFFSLRSIRAQDDSLAIGDIIGTVLADATIVVGLLALVNPFSFPQKIVFVTGAFMVAAAALLFYFMKTGKKITTREAHVLFSFWVLFVIVEFFINSN